MKQKLVKIFSTAVYGVNPYSLVKAKVRINHNNETVDIFGHEFTNDIKYHLIGFGKAVLGMSKALQDVLTHRIKSGVLSVPVSSDIDIEPPILVRTGGRNNLPDGDSVSTTEEIIRLIQKIPKNDVLIILMSGGGSSLLCKPVPGISLEDKLHAIRILTQSGANITELNSVRSRLSSVKGGGLRQLCSSLQTVCLILSDVIGDQLSTIASGPTVFNKDGRETALEVIRKYKLEFKLPRHVLEVLQRNLPEPSNSSPNLQNIIIGNNAKALKNVKIYEETEHFKIIPVTSEVNGLVYDMAQFYWTVSKCLLASVMSKNPKELYSNLPQLFRKYSFTPLDRNYLDEVASAIYDEKTSAICLLFGGETTVCVTGNGQGGRNQELAVIFSQLVFEAKKSDCDLFKEWDVSLLSAGTDGIDGPTNVAGAIGCSDVVESAIETGLDVDKYLANNDTFNLLSKVRNGKYFIRTGHTGTNVMDIHALVCFIRD